MKCQAKDHSPSTVRLLGFGLCVSALLAVIVVSECIYFERKDLMDAPLARPAAVNERLRKS